MSVGTSLHLLGVPKAGAAGQFSDLPLDKPASLLFYLAQRGDWVSRSELAFLYRPDAAEQIALANVRVYLHRAKERAWARSLEVEKSRVRFLVDTDVKAFLAALDRQDWANALALYRGPFLAGIDLRDVPGYEAWLELERQDLSQKWRLAALRHAEALELEHDAAGAELWLERLLRADPLDEEALQAYLRTLFAAGKRKQALEAYQAFCQELERELDVEPLEATRSLLESLSQGGPAAPGSKAEVRHNLPAQTTRFVGRRRELAQLAETLKRTDCRLLTLVGLGGVGKTRLALEVASRQLETYRDGVFFVPLAGVGAPELLVSSIAVALGFTFSGASDPQEQLGNYLREKELLLVLDNFEHLTGGATLLETLLEVAAGLDILVTSRLALELSGEWIFDLEGLSYPPADTEEPLAGFDAVGLFVNRAERLSASFVAEGRALEAVAELTRKVEGLPLALELAATWTRSLSVPQLLAELDGNLDLLSDRLRDLPERQRSLRMVFDHSWQRLGEHERAALSRLSVFPGGFTLEAAEQVAGVHLALLLGLINHSLVRRSREGRYLMHELIRQYAREKLDAVPDRAQRTNDLFVSFYTQLARRLAEASWRQGQQQAVSQLESELPNLRRAWLESFRVSRYDAVEQLLEGLSRVFEVRGRFQEALDMFAETAMLLEAQGNVPPAVLGKLLVQVGHFMRRLGLGQQAREPLQRSFDLLEQAAEQQDAAVALQELGAVSTDLSDYPAAERYFEESLSLLASDEDRHLRAVSLEGLGNLAHLQGRPQQARALYQECQALRSQLGDLGGLAGAMYDLGNLADHVGDYDEARRLFEESLALKEGLGDRHGMAAASLGLGRVAYQRGSYDEAERWFERALELFRETGNRLRIAATLNNLGGVSFVRGDFEKNRRYLKEALALRRELGDKSGVARCLTNLGILAKEQNRLAESKRFHQESLVIRRDIGDLEGASMSLAGIGVAATDLGEQGEARDAFRVAVHTAWKVEALGRVMDALRGLANLLVVEGEAGRALRYLGLILEHPATFEQTRKRAEGMIDRLRGRLPAQTVDRALSQGKAMQLEEVIAETAPGETTFQARQ